MREYSSIPTIVIGNLEGNPCNLLNALVSHDLFAAESCNTIPDEAALIYHTDQSHLCRTHFNQWIVCINKLELKPCKLIILGGIVATTGKNDILMLKLINRITVLLGHNLSITASHLDLLFLHIVDRNKLQQQSTYADKPNKITTEFVPIQEYNDMHNWYIDRLFDEDTLSNQLFNKILWNENPNISTQKHTHESIRSLRNCVESIDIGSFNKFSELDTYIQSYKSALVPMAFHTTDENNPNSLLLLEQQIWTIQHLFQAALANKTKELISQYLSKEFFENIIVTDSYSEENFGFLPLKESAGIILTNNLITRSKLTSWLNQYYNNNPKTKTETDNDEHNPPLHHIQTTCHSQFAMYNDNFTTLITDSDKNKLMTDSKQKSSLDLGPYKTITLMLHIRHITATAKELVSSLKKKQQLALHLALVDNQINKDHIPAKRMKYLLTMLSNKLKVKSGPRASKTHQYFHPILQRLENEISTFIEIDNEKEQIRETSTLKVKSSPKDIVTNMIRESTTILSNQLLLIPRVNKKRRSLSNAIDALNVEHKTLVSASNDKITPQEIEKIRLLMITAKSALAIHRYCLRVMCLKPHSYYVCSNNLDSIMAALDKCKVALSQAYIKALVNEPYSKPSNPTTVKNNSLTQPRLF